MILSEGVVGFGGPLQAIVAALGSCWGCIPLLAPMELVRTCLAVTAHPIVRGHSDAVSNICISLALAHDGQSVAQEPVTLTVSGPFRLELDEDCMGGSSGQKTASHEAQCKW